MTLDDAPARPQRGAPDRSDPAVRPAFAPRRTAVGQPPHGLQRPAASVSLPIQNPWQHRCDRSPIFRTPRGYFRPVGLAEHPGGATTLPSSVTPPPGCHPTRLAGPPSERPGSRGPQRAHHPAKTPGPCVIARTRRVDESSQRGTAGEPARGGNSLVGSSNRRSPARGSSVPPLESSHVPYQPVPGGATTPGAHSGLIGPATPCVHDVEPLARGVGLRACQGCAARIAHRAGECQCLTREMWLDTGKSSANGPIPRYRPSHQQRSPHNDRTPPAAAFARTGYDQLVVVP